VPTTRYFRLFMSSSDSDQTNTPPSVEFVAKATSELNNLLQIISGSSSALEKAAKPDSDTAEYLDMLRTSIDRAELLGRELASRAGGTAEKAICNSEVAGFLKRKTDKTQQTRQTVLVVDDEKMALTLIDRLLREDGYDVVVAQSGFEAVDFFRREPHRFSLVLLDFSLPFMDGEETFRRLREIRNNIPVVLCTGFILQDRLTQMMGCGLTGFLRKPVPPNELLAVVRSTIQTAIYSRDTPASDGMSVVS
jgi:CheY-like chemotaxis protein